MTPAHEVKIRRERPCEWCGETMPKGSAATSYSCINPDRQVPETVTIHGECHSAMCEQVSYGETFSPYEADRPALTQQEDGK